MNDFWDWSDVSVRGDDTRLTILGLVLFAIMCVGGLAWLCYATKDDYRINWHGPVYGYESPMDWKP